MSNVQLAQSLYEAFNTGDIATVLGMFDPGIEWREAEGNPYRPDGSPWVGGEAITQNLFMKIPSDFDGFTLHPSVFHDAGDTVVVELRYSGTGNATGKPLDAQVCHVLKFRDGKLTSFQQFADTAQLQEVMGRR
jgi:uncharacterized protein